MKKGILIICCILSSICCFSNIIELQDTVDYIRLNTHGYEMILDSTGSLGKENIQQVDWKPYSESVFIDHRYVKKVFMKFTLHNSSDEYLQYWLSGWSPHFEQCKMYLDGRYIGQDGKTVPVSEKFVSESYVMMPLSLNPGQKRTLLLEIDSDINYNNNFSLESPKYYSATRANWKQKTGFYYGVLFILFVFTIAWFIYTKEKLYLAYALYVLSIIFFSAKNDNNIVNFLFPENTWVAYYIYYFDKLVLAWGITVYLYAYLYRKEAYSLIKNVILGVSLLYSLQYVIEYFLTDTAHYYPTMLLVFYSGLVAMLTKRKFVREEYLLVIAYAVVTAGMTIHMGQSLGYLQANDFTIFVTNYSFIIDAIVFSMITARKSRLETNERLELQKDIARKSRENAELQTKVSRELEEKVKRRTQELDSKSRELERKNEQLSQQASQIMQMNEELDKLNYQLKKENQNILQDNIHQVPLAWSVFKKLYPDNAHCLKYLKETKWSNGFLCKKCGSTSARDLDALKGKRCSKCGKTESITANTLFEKVRMPLEKGFYIAYLTHRFPENIHAARLSEQIGLPLKTCYNFINKCQKVKEEKFNENQTWEEFVRTDL